jgi:ribosomal protein L23
VPNFPQWALNPFKIKGLGKTLTWKAMQYFHNNLYGVPSENTTKIKVYKKKSKIKLRNAIYKIYNITVV